MKLNAQGLRAWKNFARRWTWEVGGLESGTILMDVICPLDIDEEKFKQSSLCLCEGKAFTFVSQYMASRNNATFADMKEAMMEEFCGEDYKRTLETKLGTIKFTRESDIPLFSLELKKLIKELYRIENDKTLKLIASNHVVAELEP